MKKVLCLILPMVIMATVLAGCKSAQTNETSSTTQSTFATTPSTTEPSVSVQDPNQPTAQEDAKLKAYAQALTSLHAYAVGLKEKKNIPITYTYMDNDGNEATATGNQALI